MKTMTKSEIAFLVYAEQATNKVCFKNETPIFPEHPKFILNGESYGGDVEMDAEIESVSGGLYKTAEEAYDEKSDYYYFTSHDDAESVIDDIMGDGFYYDEDGDLVHFQEPPLESNVYRIRDLEKESKWGEAAECWKSIGRKADYEACQMIADAITKGDEYRATVKNLIGDNPEEFAEGPKKWHERLGQIYQDRFGN